MSGASERFDDQSPNQESTNGRPRDDVELTFEFETKLKEPSIPKSSEMYLKMLSELQHLDKNDWNEIRYADTQKTYNHSPGFTDIEMNEEVKAYDSSRHLIHADKAFAALTMCVLKQKEALQNTLRDLLTWVKDGDTISYEDLHQKVRDLFSTGDFHKTSSDLLQIICGHRAEIIQMRRDCVTKQAKDPLIKANLRKIPPTTTTLFDAEKFTAVIEKSGGIRKCFWPAQKANNTSASQAGIIKPRGPSQGPVFQSKPSQGFSQTRQYCNHAHTHYAINNPPPQGANYTQGRTSQYNSAAPNNRSNICQNTFRGNSSRPPARQQNQTNYGRKRTLSPHPQQNKNNKRRKF